MPEVLVLTEADLRAELGLGDPERAAIRAVYPSISRGEASMPPIVRLDVPDHNGEVDIKTAHLPGVAGIAVKVSAGFFDNPARGLPSLGGLMVVLDAETGVPQAALFDNGYLTDLRTALAGGVAADQLARPDATRVAVIGAGVQAELQVRALATVRAVEHVTVWARRASAAADLAARLGEALGVSTDVAGEVADGVAGADVLVTATPSPDPLVTAAMLHPGLHVTAVGSDAEHKQELAADVIAEADVVVCDHLGQSRRLGELRAAEDAGVDTSGVHELGAVIDGDVRGRTADEDVTVCDLTGTGAQDTAIASLAVARCRTAGRGTTVAT
jgi:ornithine cyclodeaminase